MFSSLKNKIKEETGGDVSKISSLVATPPKGLVKGRHSRTGSATSLGSFTIDGSRDDPGVPVLDLKLADGRAITPKEFKKLEAKEDEWRRKLQKKDDDFAVQLKKVEEFWKKKIEDKEKELQKVLDKKDVEISTLLSEIKELHSVVTKLEGEVKQGEEYKVKLCRYQEDFDQLEGFQTQEMAKIKHLLLQKEQLLLEKDETCNKQGQKITELNLEIRRLLEAERKLSDAEDRLEELRHTSEQEKASMTSRLAAEEESSRHLKDRIAVLEERSRAVCASLGAELTPDDRLQGLLGERALLERLLAEAHEHLAEVKTTWSGKITSLETQVGRLCRQASEESAERRGAEKQRDLLATQVRALEADAVDNEQRVCCLIQEKNDLEEEVKNLDMQLLQQKHVLAESVSSVNKDALSAQSKLEHQSKMAVVMEGKISQLSSALDGEKETVAKLMRELNELRAVHDEDKAVEEQLREDVNRERSERDDLMLRNAEVSQEVELVRRELRTAQQDASEMLAKVAELENGLRTRDETLGKERIERDILGRRLEELENVQRDVSAVEEIRERSNELESEVLEKNRMIKTLQQRINDMKKAMQRELKVPTRNIDPGGQNGDGCIPAHGPAVLTASGSDDPPDDVNFKYLKHVVFKFLTCREHEAHHLTRAVSTLLRLSSEEDRLLRETIDWRMSWFGSRPKTGPRSFRS